MAPLGWLLWFPVRKAAAIPVVVIATLSAAGLYGAFDLSRGVARMVVRPDPKDKQRPGTSVIATGMTAVVSGGVLVAREMFSKPKMPKPDFPVLNAEALKLLSPFSRLAYAGKTMAHVMQHYPYRFRFISVFVGGCVGGVTYALTEKARSGPTDEEVALAARMARLEVLEQKEEEEAVAQLGQPREKAAVTTLNNAKRALEGLVGDAKALIEERKRQQHQAVTGEGGGASATPAVHAATPAPPAPPAAPKQAQAQAQTVKRLPSLGELACNPESDPFYALNFNTNTSSSGRSNSRRGGKGSGDGNEGRSEGRFFRFEDDDHSDARGQRRSSSRVVG